MKRWWPALLLILLAAAGAGWWFLSPWIALKGMRDAARAHDVAALTAYVDYPALREDVRGQFRARAAETGSTPGHLAERLMLGLIAEGAIKAAIDGYALRAEDMEMRRDGIDQFRIVAKDGRGIELVFRRHGLGWKLAGLRLPRDERLGGG